MAFRTFALTKIGGANPQPIVGSFITQAGGAAGAFGPATSPLTLTLGSLVTSVAPFSGDSQLFAPGDPATIIDVGGGNMENVRIQSVNIGANTVTLGPQNDDRNMVVRNAHVAGVLNTGSWIMYGGDVNNIFIQCEDGNTGQWLYIGSQYNFSASYKRITKMAKVALNTQPFAFSSIENFFGMPFRMNELWVLGTANDQYTVSLGVI